MRTRVWGFSLFVVSCIFLAFPSLSSANNLNVNNVRFGSRDVTAKTVEILFDISWENSWKNKINHDAAWLTFRLNSDSTEKKLCQVQNSGLNPTGTNPGSNSELELFVPTDKVGVFVRRSVNKTVGTVASTGVKVVVNYGSCGFDQQSAINASIVGLEMVLIPEGNYYAGDGTSTAALRAGSADSDSWLINSENTLNVSAPAADGFYYVSSSAADEFPTGSSFAIPAAYPKGYKAFYVMKYEITEGQWAEFVNSLPAAARASRDLTDGTHKNSDTVISRNTISCSGSPLVCSTQRSSRALSFINWMDLCAFLDWAGLRPMTELEYEKAARGPVLAFSGEYAWGSADIVPAASLSGTAETGDETVSSPENANANYGSVTFSGGDSATGSEHAQGPLRAGVFATSTSTRSKSGSGYYGVMELSGNVREQVVTLGNAAGLAFTGLEGDGVLAMADGFAGNANTLGWPGMDADAAHGITGAAGSGTRGGSWQDADVMLRVSDRSQASVSAAVAGPALGGRGARSL